MAQLGTLNLNNDVVKMRREVKRIRVLIIRKLVSSVGRLKSKKDTEDALLKKQRRKLKPDTVTKSALDDDINFEKITTARLAVHPLLKKETDVLKAAIQTFKEARQNVAEVETSRNASKDNYSKNTWYSKDNGSNLQHEGTIISEQKVKETKILIEHGPKAVTIPNSPSKPSGKDSVVSFESQKTPADPKLKTLSQTKKGNSLCGSSDGREELCEEEEYFDDSTEESDSGGNFFTGKESSCHRAWWLTKKKQKPLEKVLLKEDTGETCGDRRNDKTKPSTETRKLKSVFSHSLSGSKSSRRNYKEQAPKTRSLDFPQNEPQIKNQFNKKLQRKLENAKQQLQLPLHPSWEQSNIAVFQGKTNYI
uniref:SRF-dependent transcription regulation-associated protein n=1 Tax=Cebus imitator TaxID=2715852 RepID=A0A2K5PA77_CEBIM